MGEYIMDIVTLAASRKYTDKKIMESGAVGVKYEIVDSLPSSGKAQTIYFVKNNNSLINDYYDEYVWISSSSTFEKIGSSQIDGSTTQPDWNQDDDTQPDYVKNRPFYTGDPVETVLVEEITVPFSDSGDGLYIGQIESTFSVTVGETYKVSWDGSTYECTCTDIEAALALGNLSIAGAGSDTGEPFIICYNNEGVLAAATDTSASHTISISSIVSPVVKIDRKYLPIPFKPKGESYLTFSSPSSFTLSVYNNIKSWDGTLEYFASDETWTIWEGTSPLSAAANGGEYVLYLRGTGNAVITGNNINYEWVLTGTDIKCIGNIENLLDYATVASGAHPTMSEYCYKSMFIGCTSLTQAPALPATTLAGFCYANMFRGCTSLTKVPALPATALAAYCYYNMFNGCSSLKLSSTKTDEYTQEYRIPSSGNGTTAANSLIDIFASTGGTFTGTPSINTVYYLSSNNMIVRETEIATLNGYVGSMINTALSKIGIAEEGAY